MFKTQQISPWSIYDANIKSHIKSSKHLVGISNKKQMQTETKRDQSKQYCLHEQNYGNQKSINKVLNHKITLNNPQENDIFLVNRSGNSGKMSIKGNQKINQKISKSSMKLKIASFSDLSSNLQVDRAHVRLKQLLKYDLILCLIKQKLNQQPQQLPYLIGANSQVFMHNVSNKFQRPLLINQQLKDEPTKLNKHYNKYEPMSIQKKHSFQNKQKQTKEQYEKQSSLLSDRMKLIDQLRSLEYLGYASRKLIDQNQLYLPQKFRKNQSQNQLISRAKTRVFPQTNN